MLYFIAYVRMKSQKKGNFTKIAIMIIKRDQYLNQLISKKDTSKIKIITGLRRSGKSFLANLMMDKMSGFRIGSTINACTKGLWVWGKPIELAENYYLLIKLLLP